MRTGALDPPKPIRSEPTGEGLVVASNFIRAVRESGYTSLSTALAELVDNSLQACATIIAIKIERASPEDLPVISVQDNGHGMNRSELQSCLRFGGTSRFDDRRSFGRFGMGLPAASLSQARQIEVIAWQGGNALRVDLDVDAVVNGTQVGLPVRRASIDVPNASGCRVVWRECDRIEYQRLAWLERALHRDLGRIYRRFLLDGLTLSINNSTVSSNDPLLLATHLEGRAAELAFEPLIYELAASSGETAIVRVRFTLLPVEAWHHLDNVTKRRAGIVGGAGVSILRAGREIAHGWHLMGGKRRENYDDWWRCEIDFDPILDEHFGITANKQGVRPSTVLREAVEAELESIARLLNARVRQAFEEVKFQAASELSCRIAQAADSHLPVFPRGRGHKSGGLTYRLLSQQLSSDAMFSTAIRNQVLEVNLNVDHPAFAALYQPLQGLADTVVAARLRTAIELLVLAMGRSTALLKARGEHPYDLLSLWSTTYSKMLQKS